MYKIENVRLKSISHFHFLLLLLLLLSLSLSLSLSLPDREFYVRNFQREVLLLVCLRSFFFGLAFSVSRIVEGRKMGRR